MPDTEYGIISALRHELNEYGGVASEGTTAKIAQLNTNAYAIKSALTAALTKQNDVNTILRNEKTRLDEKKSQIDNAQKGQMRVLQLNESHRKRQAAYLNLIILVVFSLAMVIIMKFARVKFSILPDSVYTLLHILLFSFVIIYALVTLVNVSSRENTNYDRLDLPGPEINTDATRAALRAKAVASGDLLGINNSSTCTGAACCSDKMVYDGSIGKCVSSA